MGHSNWTICSPLSHFCFQIFTTFSLSYWEANSYYPRGQRAKNGKTEFTQPKKVNERESFQCLGHSNWTICIPLSPFCSGNFPTFSLSYWEANSYYPRGPIMGRGNSSNLKSGWDWRFSVPGAFKLDHLHLFKPLLFKKFSIFFTFILGGQFLLPPEGQ